MSRWSFARDGCEKCKWRRLTLRPGKAVTVDKKAGLYPTRVTAFCLVCKTEYIFCFKTRTVMRKCKPIPAERNV